DYLTGKLVITQSSSKPTTSIDEAHQSDIAREPNRVSSTRENCSATDIAIVGMSCKLPGGIETPNQLWDVLSSETCVITAFPKNRGWWPANTDKPGIDQGGFMHDADAFDASFFRISPAEARRTDPQQRILLELAWACLEDAGILPAA